MVSVNPKLSWDQSKLKMLIQKCQDDIFFYETLSLASHIALIFFGIGTFVRFGMTNSKYFVINGTLLVIGYGPACELTVEAFQKLAKRATEDCKKYKAILNHFDKNLSDVPELKNNNNLIAQWHALQPIPVPSLLPIEKTVKERKNAYKRFVEHLEAKYENHLRKIYKAYLIHVAENPNDLREISDFGVFHSWNPKYLYDGGSFNVFGDISNTTIESSTPQKLAPLIFN